MDIVNAFFFYFACFHMKFEIVGHPGIVLLTEQYYFFYIEKIHKAILRPVNYRR